MKKNRYPDAFRSLIRLRHSPLQAARDLYYIHVQLAVEAKVIRGDTYITRFTELFTIPRVRRATLASFVVMLAQQMCGINSKLSGWAITFLLYPPLTCRNSHRILLVDGVCGSWILVPPGALRLARLRRCELFICIPGSVYDRYMFV